MGGYPDPTQHPGKMMSQQTTTLEPLQKTGAEAAVRQRDRSIDLARGISLAFMVAVHVITIWGFRDESQGGSMVCALISPIGAPTFLFLMGFCFALSSKTAPMPVVFRGCVLFVLSYVLNFFRGTLPVYLGLLSGWIETGNQDFHSPWIYFIEVDVLQCVGLCLVIMALVRKFLPWPWVWVFLAGAAVAGTFIPAEVPATESFQAYCLALIVGATKYIYFPVLPWIAFPLVGMACGSMRKSSPDKRKFDARTALVGLCLVVVGMLLVFQDAREAFRQWNLGMFLQGKLSLGVAFTFIGMQLPWLPVCGFISRTVDITPAARRLYRWSENVTVFYFAQWVIIGWLCVLFSGMAAWGILPMIVLVLFLTDASITQMEKLRA